MSDDRQKEVHHMLGEILILSELTPLDDFVKITQKVNTFNGWFEEERPLHLDGTLIASEGIEMFEEARSGHGAHEVYFTHDKNCPEAPLQKCSEDESCCIPKPEGFPTELADVFIRAFDSVARHGIDIEFEIRRKLRYNLTRGYRHGGKLV